MFLRDHEPSRDHHPVTKQEPAVVQICSPFPFTGQEVTHTAVTLITQAEVYYARLTSGILLPYTVTESNTFSTNYEKGTNNTYNRSN